MRTISHVQLTKGLFVPTLFEFKRTLSQQFYPGMELKIHSTGGVIGNFKGVQFIVPYSMIECIVFEGVEDVKEAIEEDSEPISSLTSNPLSTTR